MVIAASERVTQCISTVELSWLPIYLKNVKYKICEYFFQLNISQMSTLAHRNFKDSFTEEACKSEFKNARNRHKLAVAYTCVRFAQSNICFVVPAVKTAEQNVC